MTVGARQTPPRASASSSADPTSVGSTAAVRGLEQVARSSPRATGGPEKWPLPTARADRDRTRLSGTRSNGRSVSNGADRPPFCARRFRTRPTTRLSAALGAGERTLGREKSLTEEVWIFHLSCGRKPPRYASFKASRLDSCAEVGALAALARQRPRLQPSPFGPSRRPAGGREGRAPPLPESWGGGGNDQSPDATRRSDLDRAPGIAAGAGVRKGAEAGSESRTPCRTKATT